MQYIIKWDKNVQNFLMLMIGLKLNYYKHELDLSSALITGAKWDRGNVGSTSILELAVVCLPRYIST